MAEGEDKIKYSDIIQPDDSLERLITQLGEINKSYGTLVNSIKAGADRIVVALKASSGATAEGRQSIDDYAAAASRLERAQKEVTFAMSETGKQVAILKAQTSQVNRTTVEQDRAIKMAVSSYDKLRQELKENVALYKSLTDAEREESTYGQAVLADIVNLKNQIAALDAQMKPHIQTMSELQKAQERLNYLESEEGQQLLEVKARISEVTNARKQHKTETDALTKAKEKLAYAQSEENQQLKLYSTQTQEANTIAKLNAQLAVSAEGSYNALSAQYELNKIKLNAMSAEQREATESGKALEKETAAIYAKMVQLQESTGNYRLSVGHYQRTWDGLGISISQVVRELPAAAVSLNTFFLGISNNIPMVIDEINRLRKQNLALQKEGKATVSVTKSIVKALLSWNTILVVLLTVFSKWGKDIIAWIGNLFKGERQVISFKQAIKDVSKELENSTGSYGDNIVSLKQLQDEWKNLKTTAEKTQWIKDNKSEFDRLGISINDVAGAENAFVNNTQAIIDALRLRAKATAAQTLAAKKYEEALIARNKAETAEQAGPSGWDKTKAWFVNASIGAEPTVSTMPGASVAGDVTAQDFTEDRIKKLNKEADAAEADGDAYFDLASGYEEAAKGLLKFAKIEEKHKKDREPRQRDLIDQINNMLLRVQKKYEESITALERDEFAKRRKETIDAANAEIRTLQTTYEKNKRILANEEGLYKDLTDEQKANIEKAQQEIVETIENYQNQLTYDLEQIELDRQINELNIQEETNRLKLQAVKKGSEEELKLRKESIERQRQIAILQNRKLPTGQRQTESTISASFARQGALLGGEYAMTDFEQQQALEAARFNAIKHNEQEITRFKLQQEKERWEKQIELAKAGAIDWTDAQIFAAEETVKGINRQIAEVNNIFLNIGKKGVGETLLSSLGFNDDQIDALKKATDVVIESLQEIAQAEIDAAQTAVDAAKERVDAAKHALDYELEARANGYANNVVEKQKALALEKENQNKKQKILEEAIRRQEALNSITQASSLITASAQLWGAFSSVPLVGPALALAAIATMWTSFAAAKVKAKQVAARTEQYGEGGFEILEGGSHASGNDIDLGVNNHRNRRMKAEGGEALAIINKHKTRKYRGILPDIVDSLNKGTFEDKYINAFSTTTNLMPALNIAGTDTALIEQRLNEIVNQNNERRYNLANGDYIIEHKNLKRTIHKS